MRGKRSKILYNLFQETTKDHETIEDQAPKDRETIRTSKHMCSRLRTQNRKSASAQVKYTPINSGESSCGKRESQEGNSDGIIGNEDVFITRRWGEEGTQAVSLGR